MVKKAKARSDKFKAKHDPDAIMLRWKALRDFSIKRFYLTPIKHFLLDDNVLMLIDRYVLPYGQAGNFMDLMRKLVNSWEYLTEDQKETLRQEWISKGFPEDLFDKIAEKYNELKNYVSQNPTIDMVLMWYAELDPYPSEAYAPKEEDQTVKIDTEYEVETPKNMPYWKQEGYKEGFFIRKLVNVFMGRDKQLPEIVLSLQSFRADLVSDLFLEIPAIAIVEFEHYSFLDLTNPVVEWEMPISEIEKTLLIPNLKAEGDVNASWLDMLHLFINTANSFNGKTTTLTNLNAYVVSAYALAPNYAYLQNLTISAQSNTLQGKTLSNQILNPLVETQI
jgi:hypothetical protein